ncbi:hypothetical protein STHU_44690 [Allostella humosa]|nr:hypothetical protein STHU_44690 [Stella humosa]
MAVVCGLGSFSASASAAYRLCIDVMNLEFRPFRVQVGAGDYVSIGQERCADFTTFGLIRVRIGGDPIVECSGNPVSINNLAQVQLRVGYQYYIENKANPYQATACSRTQ